MEWADSIYKGHRSGGRLEEVEAGGYEGAKGVGVPHAPNPILPSLSSLPITS